LSGFEKPQTKCKFDEWAKPLRPLTAEAEKIIGVTNAQLAHCRSGNAVLVDFLGFISECERYPLKS
jgi:hypothetical protein